VFAGNIFGGTTPADAGLGASVVPSISLGDEVGMPRIVGSGAVVGPDSELVGPCGERLGISDGTSDSKELAVGKATPDDGVGAGDTVELNSGGGASCL
jgi:hypothetical protein